MGIHHVKSLDLHAKWPCGEKDLITDVPGVLVGHTTLTDPAKDIHTGVTAVLPHGGNLFRDKVMATCAVINGFGKSIGLLQVQELGTIETPHYSNQHDEHRDRLYGPVQIHAGTKS